MLAIRLQRIGRKAHPIYRIAVQEAQRHPTSGRVVAYVGSYNPHTKEVKIDAEKVGFYLKNGAQPSPRVVKILKFEKIALPDWVADYTKKAKKTKNVEKLRKNRPAEPVAASPPAEKEETDTLADKPVEDVVSSDKTDSQAEETKLDDSSDKEKS